MSHNPEQCKTNAADSEQQWQPDPDQQRAIEAHGGFFLVLAPPGCGKTDILSRRIEAARGHGVPYSEMLCLTFTNRASRSMRNRIAERMGDEDTRELFVGNIHRYCSRLLFEEGVISPDTGIMDEDDQQDVLCSFEQSYFTNNKNQILKDNVNYVQGLAAYITQRRLGHPKHVLFEKEFYEELYEEACRADFEPEASTSPSRAIYHALKYLKYKEFNNVIDFDDILILAYDYLIRTSEHRRYSWIQVDEVQDLNFLQLAIIDAITAPNPTVMYLGDEQQAIFSFLGAKLQVLETLRNRCANTCTLGVNYRSPKYLLDIFNEYAEKELKVNPDLLPKAYGDTEHGKFDLLLTASRDRQSEAKRIVPMVHYYLDNNPDERLAILVATNREADEVSLALEKADIDNFKISGVDMFRSASYKALTSFYSVMLNEFNMLAWSRLLYGIGASKPLDRVRETVQQMRKAMMTPADMLTSRPYIARFKHIYENQEVVMFDTETTGLDIYQDDIIQIAAFKVKNGQKVEGSDFNIILETTREIPRKLGAIDNPMYDAYQNADRLTPEVGLKRFLFYIGNCPVVGHNVNFDYQILRHNCMRHLGYDITLETYDSLKLIKLVAPRMKKYKLGFLLQTLGLEGINSHMADEDIAATKALVDWCMAQYTPDVAYRQKQLLANGRVIGMAERLRLIEPLFDEVRRSWHSPISETHFTLPEELQRTYIKMVDLGLIREIGRKFAIFINYISSEWEADSLEGSLYTQLERRINDLTSTINEGDLINCGQLFTDRVFIMTVYKGKGLEFENVVVLGANKGTYPFYKVEKTLRDPDATPAEIKRARLDLMEDARKFYVAITRARKRLCISYTGLNAYNFPCGPTRFMKHIQQFFTFRDATNRDY